MQHMENRQEKNDYLDMGEKVMMNELRFEEEYFQGEEREGFFVDSMMKRAWASQLVVLQEIDRICKKHNILYFADGGTLIGAVRHKGYIPWDDDLDIQMKRSEYMRFLQIAPIELAEGYYLHTAETRRGYPNTFARVVNSHEISFMEEHMEKFYGCPYIVGVDIFPMDTIPRNKQEEDLQCQLITILEGGLTYCNTEGEELEEILLRIETFLNVKIDREKNIRKQILILLDRISQIYGEDEGDEVAWMISFPSYRHRRLKKEWYREAVWLPFETTFMPVPVEYHKVLTMMYGDYMTPIRVVNHEYPFYKGQEKLLNDYLKSMK